MKKQKNIIKIFYSKLKKMNIVSLLLFLFKIKSNINLIFKFIFIFILTKNNDFTSIWNLDDLALKMVEGETSQNDTAQIIEEVKDSTESTELKEEVIDIESMDLGEWLDYLREHEPKAYWFWILAFGATTVFCVWLMHYLIGPGFPPKEPY